MCTWFFFLVCLHKQTTTIIFTLLLRKITFPMTIFFIHTTFHSLTFFLPWRTTCLWCKWMGHLFFMLTNTFFYKHRPLKSDFLKLIFDLLCIVWYYCLLFFNKYKMKNLVNEKNSTTLQKWENIRNINIYLTNINLNFCTKTSIQY